ncbi:hypothetical protein GFER_06800 [Geoalkalibacter ferrihydriticus DSM 17813]|uniref:Uncharacterized protein n=1 Tax=Geoalkalibacter ferrihydriticus DSM 17813 TaxID=1121915 RepID=A0A0C2HPF7_9BACT|nr:hypothetical protein GFER_06800 [Geoalkalibacter ferrihydriticus DSM 17813]
MQSLLGLTPDKLARPASATKVPQADMWRENPAEQPPPSEESVLAGEAEAVDADESLWADFTLDEEDMSGDGAPVPDEGAPFSEAQSDEDEGILDLDEEDILDLDEGDILEEDETLSSATEGDFADVSTQPDEEVEERPAVVDDWFSSEVSQEETETVPEPGFVADDAIQEEIPTEWRGLASSVAEPVSSSPAVFELSPESERITEASVAASTGLSEEAIEAVVERVAGEVVNRLAGTILEKIAWDVVPDLAESLIKDEIRKIKEALK